jgi:hypothetical protein
MHVSTLPSVFLAYLRTLRACWTQTANLWSKIWSKIQQARLSVCAYYTIRRDAYAKCRLSCVVRIAYVRISYPCIFPGLNKLYSVGADKEWESSPPVGQRSVGADKEWESSPLVGQSTHGGPVSHPRRVGCEVCGQ